MMLADVVGDVVNRRGALTEVGQLEIDVRVACLPVVNVRVRRTRHLLSSGTSAPAPSRPSDVPSIDVPSGRLKDSSSSPWSSGGIQSRPTMRFRGKVKREGEKPPLRGRRRGGRATMTEDRRRRAPRGRRTPSWAMMRRNRPARSRVPASDARFRSMRRSIRELSIGVSVKLTSIDTGWRRPSSSRTG